MNARRQIVPIIMYPFAQPRVTDHLLALYSWLDDVISRDRESFATPVTVVNRQTRHRANSKSDFDTMLRHIGANDRSEVIHVWSVDTCQMWLTGFGHAYDKYKNGNCVYWLIPGDFHYGEKKDEGRIVLRNSEELPRVILRDEADLCIGEIKTHRDASKELIDLYGTFGLLFIWFAAEAKGLYDLGIRKPRSEFFAINQDYLSFLLLDKRWFAYEQTVVILLLAMHGQRPARRIGRIDLGGINDRVADRDTLRSAMQQIDRAERVLKTLWRETKIDPSSTEWSDIYRDLDSQSRDIRNSALVMLKNMLKEGN